MEFRQIRYFASVAAHGSFNRAAKELRLTQPALSRQVKNLEEEIGLPLIDRGSNRISLTAAGEIFYQEAQDILEHVEKAIRRVRGKQRKERLRVGYVHSLTADIMPRALASFKTSHKSVHVELSDLTTHEMTQKAASGLIDIAILPKSLESHFRGFHWVELKRLSPVLVLSKKDPLAKLTTIHPNALRGRPLHGLDPSKYPEYLPRLRSILKPFGVKPVIAAQTADDIGALFVSLEGHGGMAVLTEGVIAMLPTSLTIRRFSPELSSLVISAGLPVLTPNPNAEAFINVLAREASKSSKRK